MEPISRRNKPTLGIFVGIGVIAAVAGLALDGFVGGMLQGAGVAIILVNVYFLGMLARSDRAEARGEEPPAWLPSRDRER
ncbi:hypothetical protein [Janibacter sp. GS2]|uniref:hypothetical protein n=1 Tax=Janibacter sp. GS2 TaxID=3442646 RepID=UPI003EBBEBC7